MVLLEGERWRLGSLQGEIHGPRWLAGAVGAADVWSFAYPNGARTTTGLANGGRPPRDVQRQSFSTLLCLGRAVDRHSQRSEIVDSPDEAPRIKLVEAALKLLQKLPPCAPQAWGPITPLDGTMDKQINAVMCLHHHCGASDYRRPRGRPSVRPS